jgi:hypothetical protein
MSATSVAPKQTKRNMYPNNKVLPVSEWQRGYDARKAHRPITVCASDEMAAGWVACDDAIGADSYIRAMQQAGEPFSAVLSVMGGAW